MTRISVGKLGPSTAMIPIASRMKGNASWASASVMIMLSAQPPRTPARRPSVAPTIPPTTTAAKPTSSETRAPWIVRERTSRPRWSVPSKCALPSAPVSVGAASRARSDWRTGSCGAIRGAANAVTTSSSTNAPPPSAIQRVRRARLERTAVTSAGASSARADTGIEESIDQVDAEIDHDEEHGGQEHRALHDRVIAVVDRLDREPPDARPREHRLRHHGPAEQGAELEPGDRDDRHGRVLEHVLDDHQRLGHALGAGGPDIVRAQHLEHGRPGEPGDRRKDERRETELDRRRQVTGDHPERGLPEVDRPTEVPAEHVAEEDGVLDEHGTVEAELGADAEDLAARGVGGQE